MKKTIIAVLIGSFIGTSLGWLAQLVYKRAFSTIRIEIHIIIPKEEGIMMITPQWKEVTIVKTTKGTQQLYRCIACVENCPKQIPLSEDPPKVCLQVSA